MSCLAVKVCGLTSPEDALLAVELGAGWLGLNFHPPSPRFVATARAAEIARAVAGRVPLVGVFVNRPAAEIEAIAAAVGLDLLQLHGDEGPEEAARFGERVIKVFRRGRRPAREELAAYPRAWGFLFDAPHDTLYGGTGVSWTYSEVAAAPELPEWVAGRPVLIAGGIGPDNVGEVAAAVCASGNGKRIPIGVDVCSRVESSPGVKDRQRLQRLFAEIRDGESPHPA